MATGYWPMFDIRLRTPDLELRHLTEADLATLATLTPADAEQDPALPVYDGLGQQRNRAAAVHQSYWRALGTWRPASWQLCFGVIHDGRLRGLQALEGEDFPALRTVDSYSFLAPAERGRGFGKQMRAAVLALAFGPLDAQYAISSAWTDNRASLGVSRSLGYVDNGAATHRRGDGAGQMAHVRLTRQRWLASGWPQRVTVTGFEPCRPFFGLT